MRNNYDFSQGVKNPYFDRLKIISKKHDFNCFIITLFQDEEGDWVAYFVELPNVSAFGDTP